MRHTHPQKHHQFSALTSRVKIALTRYFFVLWVIVFVVVHLWNFRTSPWNGDGLFDESGWDIWFLQDRLIGQPYKAAEWVGTFGQVIVRESLFHYYILGFFKLFGFNILSYEAALFSIWLTIFLFTLLLVQHLFKSYIVTSVTALIFIFFPLFFVYTWVGFRYPMSVAFAVMSIYFLYLGFGKNSTVCLAIGGATAGLCLASSIIGKHYLLILVLSAPFYYFWGRSRIRLRHVGVALAGFLLTATPILFYIATHWGDYTYYEKVLTRQFLDAPSQWPFVQHLARTFFTNQAIGIEKVFLRDTWLIPPPYFLFLIPGVCLAFKEKCFVFPLAALVPVAGACIAQAKEYRMMLAWPFWIVLMAFTVAWALKWRLHAAVMIILACGLFPSLRYIYSKTQNPSSIEPFQPQAVAVSRFFRDFVGGNEHPANPRLKRDELKGGPPAGYDCLICQDDAFSQIHAFLHDYGDMKILSFCNGYPLYSNFTDEEELDSNKKAIAQYVITNKNLKLVWERVPRGETLIRKFERFGPMENVSFTFAGKVRTFAVLNIQNADIERFKEKVAKL